MTMMMSSDNNILPIPGDSIISNKEEKISKEEECDYYKQRFNSLKIVLDESLKELNLYKQRFRGVTTMQLLLKESAQENDKLSKHVKRVETAISILQKRLEKNGLSSSMNIQDAELFVPGNSKQTFDNLAKENARLRCLLKQESGKKSADEIDDMKEYLEAAEAEIDDLKNKKKEMEVMKLKLVSDYEAVIEKLEKGKQELEKEKQEYRVKFEKELKSRETKQEEQSTDLSVFQELKDLLVKTSEKCNMVHDKIPLSVYSAPTDSAGRPSVSQEDFDQLEVKYREAMGMNQRWQAYSKDRELQIQGLNDRIQEVSDPHQMTAMIDESVNQKTAQMTMEMNRKNAEILELRKQNTGMSKELEDVRKYQSTMQQDNSHVEILKQQIQVCTEDFDTERKDREKAVQKARALQEDVVKLNAENANLKRQIDQLKKAHEQARQMVKPPSYESSLSTSTYNNESSPPPQYNSPVSSSTRYPPHGVPVQESPTSAVDQTIAMPFGDYPSSNVQFVGNQSPVSQPSFTSMPRQMSSSVSGLSTTPASTAPEMRNYLSMHVPAPVLYTPTSSNAVYSDMRNYGSMPRPNSGSMTPPISTPATSTLVRRGGNAKEEMMSCPKCNINMPRDTLVSHIDMCNQ